MDELATATSWIAAWLLTYLVHSTLLAVAALAVFRLLGDRAPQVTDLVCKVALVGGVATASLQLGAAGLGVTAPGLDPHGRSRPTAVLAIAGATASGVGVDTDEVKEIVAGPRPSLGPAGSLGSVGSPGSLESSGSVAAVGSSGPLWVAAAAGNSGAIARPNLAAPLATGTAQPSREPSATEHWIERLAAGLETAAPSVGELRLPMPAAPWRVAVAALWLGGAVTGVGFFAQAWARLGRRLASRRPLAGALAAAVAREAAVAGVGSVALSTSEELAVPIAIGLRRPEIVLPTRLVRELPAADLAAIVAHELGHLRRRDPLWWLGGAALAALLWPQLLNRLVLARLRDNAELLCDEWAVDRAGGRLPVARCLARVARVVAGPGAPALAPGMSAPARTLAHRVRRILTRSPGAPAWVLPVGRVAAVALLLAIAVAGPAALPAVAVDDPALAVEDLPPELEPELEPNSEPAAPAVRAGTPVSEVRPAAAGRAARASRPGRAATPTPAVAPVATARPGGLPPTHIVRAELAPLPEATPMASPGRWSYRLNSDRKTCWYVDDAGDGREVDCATLPAPPAPPTAPAAVSAPATPRAPAAPRPPAPLAAPGTPVAPALVAVPVAPAAPAVPAEPGTAAPVPVRWLAIAPVAPAAPEAPEAPPEAPMVSRAPMAPVAPVARAARVARAAGAPAAAPAPLPPVAPTPPAASPSPTPQPMRAPLPPGLASGAAEVTRQALLRLREAQDALAALPDLEATRAVLASGEPRRAIEAALAEAAARRAEMAAALEAARAALARLEAEPGRRAERRGRVLEGAELGAALAEVQRAAAALDRARAGHAAGAGEVSRVVRDLDRERARLERERSELDRQRAVLAAERARLEALRADLEAAPRPPAN